jgi:hypothetical protein
MQGILDSSTILVRIPTPITANTNPTGSNSKANSSKDVKRRKRRARSLIPCAQAAPRLMEDMLSVLAVSTVASNKNEWELAHLAQFCGTELSRRVARDGVYGSSPPNNHRFEASTLEVALMYHRLGRFALAGVCELAIAGMILFISYAIGFRLSGNMDNVWHLLRFTVPLALLVACVAAVWPGRNGEHKRLDSTFTLVPLGVAVGLAYWCLVLRTVGLGLPTLAIQALACWVAGSVAAFLLALTKRRSYGVLLSAALICALGIALPLPIFDLLAHNQLLTVAIVVPERLASITMQPKEIGFDSQTQADKSARQVLQTIQAAGLSGNYRIVHLSLQGGGKQSLAILILDAPITGRTLLPEPDAAEVIYVQQPLGWTKIPAQAPILHRNMEIWGASGDRDSLAYFGIPDATGISLMGRVAANGDGDQ